MHNCIFGHNLQAHLTLLLLVHSVVLIFYILLIFSIMLAANLIGSKSILLIQCNIQVYVLYALSLLFTLHFHEYDRSVQCFFCQIYGHDLLHFDHDLQAHLTLLFYFYMKLCRIDFFDRLWFFCVIIPISLFDGTF